MEIGGATTKSTHRGTQSLMRVDLRVCMWGQDPLFLFFLNNEMSLSCDSFLKNIYFYLFIWLHHLSWSSLVVQMVKNLPAMQET